MKRLRWYDYLTINLFWFGLNVRNTAIGSVFIPYLVDQFVAPDVKNSMLGLLRTSGLIVAMLVQPAFGILSDRSTSRFGRRRPFILVGVLFDLVFLVLVGLSGNYWMLFVVLLFQQVSANISHGPLQALIPDLAPEDQRGRASAVKAIFELLPIVLVPAAIAGLVASHQMWLAIWITCGLLLLTMLITLLTVKEKPLFAKPQISLREPMLRVLGMVLGILSGGVAGLAAGGLLGGLVLLIAWPLLGSRTAQILGISLGGLTAMVAAVLAGVWSGAFITLGKDTHGIVKGMLVGLTAGLLFGGAVWLVTRGILESRAALISSVGAAILTSLLVALLVGYRSKVYPELALYARQNDSFTWWVVNRLLFLAAVTSIQGFAMFFLMSAFQIDRDAATRLNANLIMAVGVFTVASALPGGWLSDHYGTRKMVALSGLISTLGTLVLLVTTFVPSLPLMYVAGAVIGLGAGLFMATNWAMGADLAPSEEAGRYLGVSNLAGAGAGMIGAGLGGPIADLINSYQPGLGYFVIFASYAVLFLLSSVSLYRIRIPSGIEVVSAD